MDYKERIDLLENKASMLGLQVELADEIAALRKDIENKISDDLDAHAEELLKNLSVSSETDAQGSNNDLDDDFFNSIIAK